MKKSIEDWGRRQLGKLSLKRSRSMEGDYPPPLDKLLSLGEPEPGRKWRDYVLLGLGEEHVPELIRMATDRKLNLADGDSAEVWAPLHAWRALGQLRAVEAVVPLLEQDEQLEEDDYISDEVPVVAGMVGQPAIAPLREFLKDHRRKLHARIDAAGGLSEVALQHRECRGECIAALTDQLRIFPQNNAELNGFLIAFLIELEARESAEVMEAAFEAEKVALRIAGDWEDAQVALGLLERRLTSPDYGYWDEEPDRSQRIPSEAWKKRKEKEKQKRKMAKKSRKKNKKKKKR